MKIIILYTRVPGYWMACMRAFVQQYGGEFVVISQKENPNAPFKFTEEKGIRRYSLREFDRDSLLEFCISENPDLLYVTGWTEKQYLDVANYFKAHHIPVICGGVDNKWKNTLRQKIGAIYFKLFLKNRFSHIWIPGTPQKKFAQRLGFSHDEILEGLYSADLNLFLKENGSDNVTQAFAKRFIFVGRYVEEKGLRELWKAFIEFSKEQQSGWELWCFGDGPLMEDAPEHPNITHFGFVQPEELREHTTTPGIFVLPSQKEPWGVVLHEFAAAGFPLICSEEVGAASAFLEERKNGYSFKTGDYRDLKKCMLEVADKEDEDYQRMGNKSIELAQHVTPERWAKVLKETIMDYTV